MDNDENLGSIPADSGRTVAIVRSDAFERYMADELHCNSSQKSEGFSLAKRKKMTPSYVVLLSRNAWGVQVMYETMLVKGNQRWILLTNADFAASPVL